MTFSPTRHALLERAALVGRRGDGLDDEEVARDTAATDGPGRVLDGDVVVDEEVADLLALGLLQLLRHLPCRAIAGVVVDDVEDAGRGVHELGRLGDELDWGAGEDVAGAGGVEHAGADDHRMSRLVSGARALDDRHAIRLGHVRAVDQVVLGLVLEGAAACQRDPLEELRDELLRVVDELLHSLHPPGHFPYFSRHAALIAWKITPMAVAPASTEPMLRSPV